MQNLENLLLSDDKNVAKWFMKNLPGEIYENVSPQYELQVVSAMQIRKVFGGGIFKNIKGIYFGSDQCEFLLPTIQEIQKAIELLKEFDKKYVSNELKRFTLLTSFYGNGIIRERLIENLDYLNCNASNINPKTGLVEIVVNDLGTLKLVQSYDKLVPILGRLMVKTLKNPIIDTLGIDKGVHIPGEMMKNKSKEDINEIRKKISDKQLEGIGNSALTNHFFLDFFEKYNIDRYGIDYIKDFQSLYKTDKIIDIYYPYALVYVGRLCDTAAIDDVRRGYYPIDDICRRTCNKYDINLKDFDSVGYKLVLRGNSSYKTQVELALDDELINKYENRLVYSPLV
ncbi:MAG: hypothetical protein V3575_05355 [Candidatus Absconditabacteria bacterium]